VVIQNAPGSGPGRLGTWLAETGVALDVIPAHDGGAVPEEPGPGHAAVVVLLGICLGGQLLAHVAGGTVAAGSGRPEFGSTPITMRPEAAEDPLFRGLPPTVPAIERHRDAITALPPGAAWLAESAACPHQAFRLGPAAWGVQFHPEVAAERLRGWHPEWIRKQGLDPERLCRQAEADEAASATAWRTVARRFAAVVRGS
jgi:GMP synthase (glutamine-hydrolysing)